MNSAFKANTASEERLASYLAAVVPGFEGPVKLEKFSGGQSNPTYLLQAASGQYVLRSKPPGQLLASAHAVDREYRVLQALADSPVPVARPLHLCEDDSIFGAMFYLMEYVPGRIFWNPALPELVQQDRRPILEAQVEVLADLHDVDIEAAGLANFGASGDYYQRQLSRWKRQYRAAETGRIDAVESLLAWLEVNQPNEKYQATLVHGDFRLDNLIFATDKPQVLAVLDWELSTLGHPYSDLAYLCMCLRLPDSGAIIGLAGKDRVALGLPSEQDIVRQYCQRRGLDRIDNWHFYLAFSFFRLAAICQGVYKRAQQGNASDANAGGRANITGDIAAMGLAITLEES